MHEPAPGRGESVLQRLGRANQLCYRKHALMDNRKHLCPVRQLRQALHSGTEASKRMPARRVRNRIRHGTLGADRSGRTGKQTFLVASRGQPFAAGLTDIVIRRPHFRSG